MMENTRTRHRGRAVPAARLALSPRIRTEKGRSLIPTLTPGAAPLPRMRTIGEAAAMLKAMDPDTAVTEYYIRQLVLTGALPHVCAGCKRMINFDRLLDYLREAQGE